MDNLPLVSVITPLYNAEKYIAQTIESVLSQTYPQWEMLVVDNCSSDASKDIVKSFNDPRIKLIELEYNSGGPARPRNIGMEHAQGEYIAFLDSDDVWLANKLEKQLEIFKNYNVDIVHSLSYTINTKSEKIGILKNQRVYNFCKYFMTDKSIIYLSNYININSSLMKKDMSIQFQEDKYCIAIEDWLFWIENLYSNKKSFLLKEYLLNYRIDFNSISDRKSDISYRKAFYMYSKLFLQNKISLILFIISLTMNSIKLILRNYLYYEN